MEITENEFKAQFKYYKRKQPPPSFEQVLDVRNPEHSVHFIEKQPKKLNPKTEMTDINDPKTEMTDINDPKTEMTDINDPNIEMNDINDPTVWKIHSSTTNPGFHIITNALSSAHQMTWARRSLERYSSKEFKRNIDLPGSRLDNIDDWYSHVVRRGQYVDKLRWATLGYHHDWDTKVYSDAKSSFPTELFNLCALVADAIGYPDFKAQAAIVNFYPMSGTLSSHTDHSELNTQHPIISISLGQSAIFLLGGSTLAVKPTSFLLQSGDIAVMERGARLAYHAVPRIVKSQVKFEQSGVAKISSNEVMVDESLCKTSLNDLERRVTSEKGLDEPQVISKIPETQKLDDIFTKAGKELFCVKYLDCHRININARQVH